MKVMKIWMNNMKMENNSKAKMNKMKRWSMNKERKIMK